MFETPIIRKNKISLTDYDYKKDIDNRVFLLSLSQLELNVLEELLFSSIKTSISKLTKDLKIPENQIISALEKFQKINLVEIDSSIITIEKKLRKYFEFEYQRFDENFSADLSFINTLLSKIPIHIIPIWYCLPKTSNNIFKSIIEKYFLTPQIFQRHLQDLENENPIFAKIIKDLYSSPNLTVSSKEIKEKYNLQNDKYFEYILFLEFNFVCFSSYKKTKNGYEEVLTPFLEYTHYLTHFNNTKTPNISNSNEIIKRKSDFSFVEDLSTILKIVQKPMSFLQIENILKKELIANEPNIKISDIYITNLINKLLQIKFLEKNKGSLEITPSAEKWIELAIDHRALHLYYHPLNILKEQNLPKDFFAEKPIREAEKSISRVVKNEWVFFDDFIKGVMSPISDDQQVKLTPNGKIYKYSIPLYSNEEILFIKKVIFERLFEAGVVNIGFFDGKDCFSVTQLGKKLFDVN